MTQATPDARRPAALSWRRPALVYLLIVVLPMVGGLALLLLNARPDLAARALAVIHMDMVGGDAEITKAVFHVTRSPESLPTFVNDVGAGRR